MEKFLDTPVKRYSSGMYVRLAFAVAAHLEPEILIVDEVLAVGDAAFQKKCMGKMEDVSENEGRTILFVSHNLLAIKQLCDKGLFFESGNLVVDGKLQDVVNYYMNSRSTNNALWKRNLPITESHGIFFEEVSVTNSQGKIAETIRGNEYFYINLSIKVLDFIERGTISIRIVNKEDLTVFTTSTSDLDRKWLSFEAGVYQYKIEIDSDFLYPGRYSLHMATFMPKKLFDLIDNQICFEIDEIGNIVTEIGDNRIGFMSPILQWQKI